VDLCRPQRLVGVDVPDPGDHGLVQKDALDLGALLPDDTGGVRGVERSVQRVHGDMRHRIGHPRSGELPASEGALVDEAEFQFSPGSGDQQ